MSRVVAALGLLLLSASAVSGQTVYGSRYHWDDRHHVAWSNQLVLGAATDFDRMVAADPDGNGESDLFVRADGYPVCVFAPTSYGSMHESSIGVPATDLAVIDDVGRDLLLVVNGTGLHRFDLDSSTMGFFEVPISGIDPTAWSGVTLLRAFDEPAAGCSYVVGVDQDGVTVRVARYVWAYGFAPEAGFTLGGAAQDLVFPRWDALAGRDLAFLCADGLRVVDRLGSALEPLYPSWHAGGFVTTLAREDLAAREHVVWITEAPTQLNWLMFTLGEGLVDGPVVLSLPVEHGGDPVRVEPVSISAGDVDQDGDEEVALSLRDSEFDYLMLNGWLESSGESRFSSSSSAYIQLEVSSDGSATTGLDGGDGALVESFGDGVFWSMRPLALTGGLLVRPMLPFPNGYLPVHLPLLASHEVFAAPEYMLGVEAGDLRVRIWVPAQLEFEPTHIRSVLWRQPSPGGTATYIESPSERHTPFLVARESQVVQEDQELSIPVPEAAAFLGGRYFVELRFQQKSPQGVVLRSSQSIAAVLVVEWNEADVLAGLAGLDLDGSVYEFSVASASPGTTLVGAFGPLIRIPEFEEIAPPRVSPPEAEVPATTWAP